MSFSNNIWSVIAEPEKNGNNPPPKKKNNKKKKKPQNGKKEEFQISKPTVQNEPTVEPTIKDEPWMWEYFEVEKEEEWTEVGKKTNKENLHGSTPMSENTQMKDQPTKSQKKKKKSKQAQNQEEKKQEEILVSLGPSLSQISTLKDTNLFSLLSEKPKKGEKPSPEKKNKNNPQTQKEQVTQQSKKESKKKLKESSKQDAQNIKESLFKMEKKVPERFESNKNKISTNLPPQPPPSQKSDQKGEIVSELNQLKITSEPERKDMKENLQPKEKESQKILNVPKGTKKSEVQDNNKLLDHQKKQTINKNQDELKLEEIKKQQELAHQDFLRHQQQAQEMNQILQEQKARELEIMRRRQLEEKQKEEERKRLEEQYFITQESKRLELEAKEREIEEKRKQLEEKERLLEEEKKRIYQERQALVQSPHTDEILDLIGRQQELLRQDLRRNRMEAQELNEDLQEKRNQIIQQEKQRIFQQEMKRSAFSNRTIEQNLRNKVHSRMRELSENRKNLMEREKSLEKEKKDLHLSAHPEEYKKEKLLLIQKQQEILKQDIDKYHQDFQEIYQLIQEFKSLDSAQGRQFQERNRESYSLFQEPNFHHLQTTRGGEMNEDSSSRFSTYQQFQPSYSNTSNVGNNNLYYGSQFQSQIPTIRNRPPGFDHLPGGQQAIQPPPGIIINNYSSPISSSSFGIPSHNSGFESPPYKQRDCNPEIDPQQETVKSNRYVIPAKRRENLGL